MLQRMLMAGVQPWIHASITFTSLLLAVLSSPSPYSALYSLIPPHPTVVTHTTPTALPHPTPPPLYSLTPPHPTTHCIYSPHSTPSVLTDSTPPATALTYPLHSLIPPPYCIHSLYPHCTHSSHIHCTHSSHPPLHSLIPPP